MGPWATAVSMKIRAGARPSAQELSGALREGGCDQAEAQRLTASYMRVTAGRSTGEDRMMDSLRSFRFQPE